jgi:3,4-dihydroxy 2-butanone 4-phosphate synthase/GTP cyclohydrolase II
MHQVNPLTDTFGETGDRTGILTRSMEIIGEEGAGLIVAINRLTPDFFSKLIRSKNGATPRDMDELRDYGVGAQILAEMGVHDMILLTNSHHSLVALDGYGLSVVGQRPIDM